MGRGKAGGISQGGKETLCTYGALEGEKGTICTLLL